MGGVRFFGSGNCARTSLMNCAPIPVKSAAGAPATIPSKSSGKRCASIDLSLEIVQRPARFKGAPLMSGIGPGGRVARVDDRVGDKLRLLRLVHDRTDEAAASSHQELAIPAVGQQQRELDLRAD